MCGREKLSTDYSEIKIQLKLGLQDDVPNFTANWNMAPTQMGPIARLDDAGRRRLDVMKWGLLPFWAKDASLWDFLMAAPIERVLALHAFGVSQSVLAVVDVDGGKPTCRSAHADQLATALSLDMNAWWSLERGDYLGRVSKDKIAAAVAEGVGPQAADNIAGLKKAGMVAAALDRLAGTNWLPKTLRTPTACKDCDAVGPTRLAAE